MPRLLDNIETPADVRKLSIRDLPILAQEIRDEIVNTVSKTGGHLAPSLGVVELTIALHYVFDTPHDRIIWDVGHQAYAHKLLTGRRDRFHTLRQKGGISGFPKRSESRFDHFDTGHSSTSISAGLGMSVGLELKEDDARVIAVIGDGSLTGGIAYEGLNQAGELKKNLIVILNDNEMSISANVGALSSFLSRKLTAKSYVAFKREVQNFLRTVPGIGENIIQLIKRSEDSFRSFIFPSVVFEAFDFEYLGPIRGHRFNRLIEAFTNSKNLDGPVLIHVYTEKGKGYGPAEENPAHFHGVGAFEVETGNSKKRVKTQPTYTQIFGQTLVELAEKDDKIVAITAAMPEGTGLAYFQEKLPERFYDVGIAEQHAITFGAGLALEGFRPVIAIYSTFMQRGFDQIIHDVCLQNLPVTFAMDRGGLVGEDGPTHHGIFDLSFMRALPNMTVMVPKDENEFRRMLKTAVYHEGPVALRYPRGQGAGVPLDKEIRPLEIARAEILRSGKDLLILAIGSMVLPSVEAAEILVREGIEATVMNARFVKPLDEEMIIARAGESGKVLCVEENTILGGLGSAVSEILTEVGLPDLRLKRLGIPDVFVEHGTQTELRAGLGLNPEGIARAARKLLS
ncbi:MAG: 1-deoxy-D-xylulose-5-phosphate synthase [Deltaproteobacteria bacterium]|nr:1-deoxy-D-xylulose-5-phosphate synthase [Deltaproteobacteria bacterium]